MSSFSQSSKASLCMALSTTVSRRTIYISPERPVRGALFDFGLAMIQCDTGSNTENRRAAYWPSIRVGGTRSLEDTPREPAPHQRDLCAPNDRLVYLHAVRRSRQTRIRILAWSRIFGRRPQSLGRPCPHRFVKSDVEAPCVGGKCAVRPQTEK